MSKYAQSFLIVGAQESGKTFYTIKELIPQTNRPVLAVISDDLEEKWKPYKLIQIHQVNKLKPGIKYKIIWDIDDKHFWLKLRTYTRNYFIVMDDAGFFLTDPRAIEFQRIFMKNRQTNNHLVFICHEFAQVPPALWAYFSRAVIFRTTAKIERADYKTPEWVKPVAEYVNFHSHKNQFFKVKYKIR